MSIKKPLGGPRLGSGNKMDVEMHGYDRSTHDLSYIWRSTMACGTLVPFMNLVGLPGDTFDIEINADVKTLPTIGPLFGSYKLQCDIFTSDVRLYQRILHNDPLKVGLDMAQVKLPQMDLIATPFGLGITDYDNAQVNPSCVLKYLGISGVANVIAENTRRFNALGLLSYWDIYKNYYANKQEEIGAVIHAEIEGADNITAFTVNGFNVSASPIPLTSITDEFIITYSGGTPPDLNNVMLYFEAPAFPRTLAACLATYSDNGVDTITGYYEVDNGALVLLNYAGRTPSEITEIQPQVKTFPLSNLDDMRDLILAAPKNVPYVINDANLTPYSWVLGSTGDFPNKMNSQEGLAIKTYQSDKFNNWLSTDWISGAGGINEITAIDVSAGSFTIDQLILGNKVFNMLNRIAIAGGSYTDYVEVNYDTMRMANVETPIYHGGLSKEIVFQEVVNNSASQTSDGTQPLGTLAGRGTLSQKHKGGQVYIKPKEYTTITGIVSITPRIDYSQGNSWDVLLETMADFHVPAMDGIGFQELIQEEMAWWTTELVGGNYVLKSAGKQPAWINYMTNVNKTYGDFAILSNSMFMTLNRRYEYDPATQAILDLTTYIDPVKYNNIFAQTSLSAQNFWVQLGVKVTARRVMSAKVIPNL